MHISSQTDSLSRRSFSLLPRLSPSRHSLPPPRECHPFSPFFLSHDLVVSAELARIIQSPQSGINQIERGQKLPGAKILLRLIKSTDINISWLLGDTCFPLIRPTDEELKFLNGVLMNPSLQGLIKAIQEDKEFEEIFTLLFQTRRTADGFA
ncbi:MAG TPA: helix-turn-helix transcriptional regulator, partial [Anaerolineales bacterium]